MSTNRRAGGRMVGGRGAAAGDLLAWVSAQDSSSSEEDEDLDLD